MAVGRDYFGSYRLIRLVRVGHTCQIWEAIDEQADRRCALKSLQKEHVHDKEEIGYLKHEFAVGKPFSHPRVIDTYEFVTKHELPFLVLEFYPSQNLKQLLRNEPEKLSGTVKDVIIQAAEGLAYFHRQGWVHRDVKPDNFLVGEDGNVKLIDFALAYQPPKGLGKLFSFKTKVMGTRSYMSPEQIRGGQLDQRADIYSFGCMAYELLAGKLPFTAPSANELLTKHLSAAVPVLAAANRDVTPEISDLIGSMMAKKADKRPATINTFLQKFKSLRLYKTQRKG